MLYRVTYVLHSLIVIIIFIIMPLHLTMASIIVIIIVIIIFTIMPLHLSIAYSAAELAQRKAPSQIAGAALADDKQSKARSAQRPSPPRVCMRAMWKDLVC